MDNYASDVYGDTSFFDNVVYIEKLRALSESASSGKSCSRLILIQKITIRADLEKKNCYIFTFFNESGLGDII